MRIMAMVVLLSLSFVSLTYAEDHVLIVVINETPPWKMLADGQAKGIDINITNALASRLNLKVEYRMLPFKRCLKWLEHGEADLMGFLTYKDERKAFLRYLQPPYQGDTKIFYVRKGEAHRLREYKDLYNLRVGIILGHKHFEPFDSDKNIVIHEATERKSNYLMLISGRIDCLIENDTQGPYNAHRFGVADKIEMAPYKVPLGKNGFFAMSKKSKYIERVAEFEQQLREMVQRGEVDAIIKESLDRYNR